MATARKPAPAKGAPKAGVKDVRKDKAGKVKGGTTAPGPEV